MALIDKLETMLPGWMVERSHWLALGGTFAAVIDALIEGVHDGVLGALPGQIDDLPFLGGFAGTDGLPLIGRDRRIPRGLLEKPGVYAAALREWLFIHRRAGTAFGFLAQVRRVLGPSFPRVRLVTGAGVWHTIESDGSMKLHTPAGTGLQISAQGVSTPLTTPAHPWDWDGSGNPFQAFLIVYAPVGGLIAANEGTWGDGSTRWGREGEPGGGLIGIDSTLAVVNQLRGLINEFGALGVTIPWVVVAFDADSFDPETPGPYPAAGMPDGTWGRAGRLVGGVYTRTRLSTARYVRGVL
ncbi:MULTISPECIES: hypothetical protein [Sorangium]|uniref:Uncharacterized protein n=1 Tax=Sorangium cellulosum TaxID=56 RepID=A0A4V0NGH1_SORCE|nr:MULTISPECIES: hypothetical protein [Sorangium]AUX33152.1 uncharacterized protein SOCE836_053060 [Sorangium cellulosum]AUX33209.1 uncharacterized protein SOCE836_053630 [Sorangium cellulosum]WCQ92528.1 hypothetical protein NQZ70_05269 [Sorangium sp. Soce836]